MFSLPCRADLVGEWKFNGSDGIVGSQAIDTSGEGNDGTITGAVATAGKIGQALIFNGANDVINCGNNASMANIFDGGGTVCTWINPKGGGGDNAGRIVKKRSGWILLGSGTGVSGELKIRFIQDFDTTDGDWITNDYVATYGEWTHVVVIYDNGNVANIPTFYINGAVYTGGLGVITTPEGTRVSDTTSTLFFGNDAPAADRTFDGAMDEVRIYNETLTPAQILTLYQLGRNILMNPASSGKILMTPSATGKLKFGEE